MKFFQWLASIFRRNKMNRNWSHEGYGEQKVADGKDAVPLDPDSLNDRV